MLTHPNLMVFLFISLLFTAIALASSTLFPLEPSYSLHSPHSEAALKGIERASLIRSASLFSSSIRRKILKVELGRNLDSFYPSPDFGTSLLEALCEGKVFVAILKKFKNSHAPPPTALIPEGAYERRRRVVLTLATQSSMLFYNTVLNHQSISESFKGEMMLFIQEDYESMKRLLLQAFLFHLKIIDSSAKRGCKTFAKARRVDSFISQMCKAIVQGMTNVRLQWVPKAALDVKNPRFFLPLKGQGVNAERVLLASLKDKCLVLKHSGFIFYEDIEKLDHDALKKMAGDLKYDKIDSKTASLAFSSAIQDNPPNFSMFTQMPLASAWHHKVYFALFMSSIKNFIPVLDNVDALMNDLGGRSFSNLLISLLIDHMKGMHNDGSAEWKSRHDSSLHLLLESVAPILLSSISSKNE